MPSPRLESEHADAAPLGRPLKFEFSGRSAPNRFLKGAMTERLSSWDPKDLPSRGVPSDDLINLYKRWGEGAVGLILSGNIMIEYDHLEAAGNPIITRNDPPHGDRFERFRALATASKAHGSLLVGQISHPGRQVQDRIQPNPVSASDVQLKTDMMGMQFGKPRAATKDDIVSFIEGWAYTAEYLEKAGFDGVQLHGAHGYLIAQFLSQTTNQRADQYGGNIHNRGRLIIEIAEAIRKRVKPNFIIGIKLNSVEFQDKGFTPEEARELCALLEQARFDFVELSGGTYEKLAFEHTTQRESTIKREAFFIEFAELIAPVLKHTKTYVTGGLRTVGAMVKALDVVDGVGLARPLTQEPHLCKDILDGKVQGAIKLLLDPNDFASTVMASGMHMKQIGKDQQPIDLSSPENAQQFQKDVGAFMQKMSKDTDFKEYGFADSTAAPVPYGVASV